MTKNIKVIMACDTFAPDINGAARFAERLAGGLARNGHEVHIIAASQDSFSGMRIEQHDGVNLYVHRMPSIRVLQHASARFTAPWGLKRNIRKILIQVQPTAVHIQSHLLMGRFALWALAGSGIRVIATNHLMPENIIKYSFLPKFLHNWARRVVWRDTGKILRKVDVVTTPTRRAADLLENSSGLTGVLAISCGINASRFANSTPTSNTDPLFLFLGRLDDEKRIPTMLRAVASLTQYPNIKVELVGDGSERGRLKSLAIELGIKDRVKFLGHIPDDDLPGTYERCTAFVMPSIAELQSIATMEAMASGRPVIGADAMALPHLVHDGDNGYLFPPDDVPALAERMRRILEADEQELLRLSENSLHLIQAHDIERTVSIFEDLYRGVGEDSPTTADNEGSYSEPIGRLSESIRERLQEFRADAERLRRRAGDLSHDAKERFGEVREEMREQFSEIRTEVEKAAKKLRRKKDD
jgi:glycosyltransferase involved in cell wall biosynthesis